MLHSVAEMVSGFSGGGRWSTQNKVELVEMLPGLHAVVLAFRNMLLLHMLALDLQAEGWLQSVHRVHGTVGHGPAINYKIPA